MSSPSLWFLTFILRVLFNFTKRNVFRINDASEENDRAGEQKRSRCEDISLRSHINKLSSSKERYMRRRLWRSDPCAIVPSYVTDEWGCANLIEEYQNTILALEAQRDKKSEMIIRGNDELRKLKNVLVRAQQSDYHSKRTLGALEAKCEKIASNLSAATRTSMTHASTIKKYEKFCHHLLVELENVIGQHKVNPLASHTLFEFVSHTLREVVKVKRHLGTGGHQPDSPTLMAYDDRYTQNRVCYAGDQEESSVGESVGTQTESSVAESVGTQTESSVAESVGTQTESSVAESVGTQTDVSVGMQTVSSVGMQTDSSVGMHTDSSVGESVAVQTDSSVGESVAVQTDSSVGESVAVQTDTCFHQTVGVQTCFDGNTDSTEMVSDQEDFSPMQDIVSELLDKFGHDTRWKTSRYNLDVLLTKIGKKGLQSLLFPELSFFHRKICAQSAKLFEKYTPLLNLAKERFMSLRSSTIRYKYDIVHIFSTLDTVLEIKNKELVSLKNSYTADQTKLKTSLNEQTQKRIAAENKILEIRAENERLIKRYRS